MEGDNFLDQERLWYPLGFINIYHPFSSIHVNTILNTWIGMLSLAILVLVSRILIKNSTSRATYIIKQIIQSFIDLVEQSVGKFVEHYFTFTSSIFLFILACNWVGLLPGIEEPTKDINTTLALSIVAFIYIHKETIKTHGIITYLKDYFMPFERFFPLNILAGLAILPLKLLGEMSTVISLSFRLFGNIFGGSIITSLARKSIGDSLLFNFITTFSGFNILLLSFFILFEGLLQAFVFSILSLTNLAMAVKIEEESEASGSEQFSKESR